MLFFFNLESVEKSCMRYFPVVCFTLRLQNLGCMSHLQHISCRLAVYQLLDMWPVATAVGGIAPSLLVSSRENVSSRHHPVLQMRKPRHRQVNITWPRTPARVEVWLQDPCQQSLYSFSNLMSETRVPSLRAHPLGSRASVLSSEPHLVSELSRFRTWPESREDLNVLAETRADQTSVKTNSGPSEGHGSDFALLEGTF